MEQYLQLVNATTKFIRVSVLLVGVSLSAIAYAADIQVSSAWARATLPGQDVGMVSLIITSKQAAKLVGISSTACKSVEMHSMTHENNMMKMREVKTIPLPAGETIDFDEEGYHLMLIGLKAPLIAGEKLPLTLRVKQANQRVVKANIQAEVKSVTTTQTQD
ncbi:MAG: copper chaperone PCu(A)C [Gallionella sp.]|nr:copper chaperone PCu(A)C [Gallionella sp.]